MHITQRRWTRTSPWDVFTSPLDQVGPMVHVISCEHAADAERIVAEQNQRINVAFERALNGGA